MRPTAVVEIYTDCSWCPTPSGSGAPSRVLSSEGTLARRGDPPTTTGGSDGPTAPGDPHPRAADRPALPDSSSPRRIPKGCPGSCHLLQPSARTVRTSTCGSAGRGRPPAPRGVHGEGPPAPPKRGATARRRGCTAAWRPPPGLGKGTDNPVQLIRADPRSAAPAADQCPRTAQPTTGRSRRARYSAARRPLPVHRGPAVVRTLPSALCSCSCRPGRRVHHRDINRLG